MTHVSFDDFEADVAKHCDTVEGEGTELVVSRDAKDSLVVISASEWSSIQETLHLHSSSENADRLLRSMTQVERGEVVFPDEFNS